MPDAPSDIAALLWDVGGTLLDRVMSPDEQLDAALRDLGVPPADVDAGTRARAQALYLASEPAWRTEADERRGWAAVASALLPGPRAEALGARLADYEIVYRPIEEINGLLDDLKGRGMAQAVVSNWPPSLRRLLEHHRLAAYFDPILSSGEVGLFKPDPALLVRALHRLGIGAPQAVFIGNDPSLDIAPARALGLRTVHFDPRRQHPSADAHDVPGLRQLLFARIERN